MRKLNLGIVAHVDAGKTSLTERLLYRSGALAELGSVDAGSTQTDSMDLERRRGITIRSAVASFVVDDVVVNLVDTPGHPDFIAEVERVLGVLDGAVLVLSAVEGVQSQTRVLMRALQRLRIPTLVFVNKVDRGGARYDGVLADVAELLTPSIVPMGSVSAPGSRRATSTSYGPADRPFVDRMLELLTRDDAFLAEYVRTDGAVPYPRMLEELAAQTGRAQVHPVFPGSAVTGTGVDALVRGLTGLLPAARADVDAPLAARVFKIDRGPAGERIAYVRVFAGAVRTRDKLRLPGRGAGEEKVTGIRVFDRGAAVRRDVVVAGEIAQLWGLCAVQVGDALGALPVDGTRRFAAPTLETVVVPCSAADRGALHAALTQLAEQDPLIGLRQDALRQELSVTLYGEVQKEVLQATLSEDFGVEVLFRESSTICIERPIGTGAAVETIAVEPNPFLATVGLRVDPVPVGSGVVFRLEVELGSMPYAFFTAVEETVHATLREGLHGWQVTDCTVTMTHSGYWARQSHSHGSFDKSMSSTAGDFRGLTPLVLMAALRRAGTAVLEPVHRFTVEIPAGTYGAVLPVLARSGAVPEPPVARGGSYAFAGTIPAARVHALQQQLPALTGGAGVLESAFDHYAPVTGSAPTRPRTDADPLDRTAYLLHVLRRV